MGQDFKLSKYFSQNFQGSKTFQSQYSLLQNKSSSDLWQSHSTELFFKVLHFIHCFPICIKLDNPFLSLNVKLTKSLVIFPKCHHKYFLGVTNLFKKCAITIV